MTRSFILPLVLVVVVILPVSLAIDCEEFIDTHEQVFSYTDPTLTIESPHNYCDDMHIKQTYEFVGTGPDETFISFDPQSELEDGYDHLTFSWTLLGNKITHKVTGDNLASFIIPARSFSISFFSDHVVGKYGYTFSAIAGECASLEDHTFTFNGLAIQTFESPHPYCSNHEANQVYDWSHQEATTLVVEFHPSSQIEAGDSLEFSYEDESGSAVTKTFSRDFDQPFHNFVIPNNNFSIKFVADDIYQSFGYRFTVDPRPCANWENEGGAEFNDTSPQIIESPHNYCSSLTRKSDYVWTDSSIESIEIEFDESCRTEKGRDVLTISFFDSKGGERFKKFSGKKFENFKIPSANFKLYWSSDQAVVKWGYKFKATPRIADHKLQIFKTSRSFLHHHKNSNIRND